MNLCLDNDGMLLAIGGLSAMLIAATFVIARLLDKVGDES